LLVSPNQGAYSRFEYGIKSEETKRKYLRRLELFVDFNADDDSLRIRECPHCLEYEIHNKLGPKIKKKDEPRAPDDEQFL
jgi:hypothetical protein